MSANETQKLPFQKPTKIYISMGILLICTILAYHQTLSEIFRSWLNNQYYSHGFIIPVISFYLIYNEAKNNNDSELHFSLYKFIFIVTFLVVTIYISTISESLFISSLFMIIFLLGTIFLLFDRKFAHQCLFPLLFLIFMIPIPDSIFNLLIPPLQLIASRLGEILLEILGVPVLREGIYLHLAPFTIEVAESCSSMHTLIALSSLSFVIAFWLVDSIGKRVLIVASSIPLAIIANGFRLVLIVLLALFFGKDVFQTLLHPLSGKVFFLVALAFLILEAVALNKLSQTRIFASILSKKTIT